MRVLVVGGYGLIGGYVVAELVACGHEVIGAGRDIGRATRRFPHASWLRIDLATATPAEWRDHLQGVDAVVNCAGALQDSPGDKLQRVHVEGLKTLALAAREAGVARFVHISAVGVADSAQPFGRTKLMGEQALAATELAWTILRPGLVLAPAAFGGTALLRGLAAFPLAIPAIRPDAPIQVVAAGDVGCAVAAALDPAAPTCAVIDLVAPPTYRLDEILKALRAWLGLPPAPVLALPLGLARLTGRLADALSWLGWRSPMRTTAVAQLVQGVEGDPADAARLGLSLQTLEQILARAPSGVQERWFARLYFAKPLAIATLAAFWIASGLIGLARIAAAANLLTAIGVDTGVAKGAVVAGAVIDLLLGLGVCLHRRAADALRGMLLVSVGYLAAATALRPDLWADPMGPLVKVVPAAALAALTLAILDER
jgi:uncharacterized protein YbjT (DUF2867 family)